MKAKAALCLKFLSKKQLETVFDSLKPETRNPTTSRSRASLKKDDMSLALEIEAKDTVALRAALNAYLRWISSTQNVVGVLERH
jgi:tRNA threonylcarbamoyladenosine modification (KEOPS) complex  Pcc1 subunit